MNRSWKNLVTIKHDLNSRVDIFSIRRKENFRKMIGLQRGLLVVVCVWTWLSVAGIQPIQAVFRECSSFNITRCTSEAKPADVMYLVDASESMFPHFFYGQMLDYVLQLQCTLNETLPNRVGMLLFSNQVSKVIPLGRYTPLEFYNRVEAVRQDPTACCTCCTPLVSLG
jgi:hypothetical protein